MTAAIRDTSKYQLMPDMSPAEFEALKADIAQRGVVVPIDVDETGEILDGHHRYRAWVELKRNEPPPTIVRAGLSEQEKRAFARKNNILRRHLTREQVRRLIAEQLKDSPDWADNRIADELGVDHKTVGSVRGDLEATWEIPKLDALVGKDGKARQRRKAKPASRPALDDIDDEDEEDVEQLRGRRRRDEWDKWADPVKQAKMLHAFDLIGMGADPNSEKVQKLIREGAAVIIKSPPGTYDPLHGRSDEEKREWHVFTLFLSYDPERQAGGEPQGVVRHVEWILQRPFQNVSEWLGPEGDNFRKQQRWAGSISEQFKADWAAFLAKNRDRDLADLIKELETRQQRFEQDRTAGIISISRKRQRRAAPAKAAP